MSLTRLVMLAVSALTTPLLASGIPQSDAAQHDRHTLDAPTLLQHVRQVTEPFKDVNRAITAGYAPFLGCVSGPEEGAMGLHFVNQALVGDGELDVEQPEALLYESTANGEARLLGVEYVVLADAWHAHHAEPPVLEGQLFHLIPSPNRFGLPAHYALHVWAWRDNPNGAFVNWNPRVSCNAR